MDESPDFSLVTTEDLIAELVKRFSDPGYGCVVAIMRPAEGVADHSQTCVAFGGGRAVGLGLCEVAKDEIKTHGKRVEGLTEDEP